MATQISVKEALNQSSSEASILVQGWVRTRRDSKDFSFIELNDGSCMGNVQVNSETVTERNGFGRWEEMRVRSCLRHVIEHRWRSRPS